MSQKNGGDRKRQNFLKAIFNVKEYTKNLKKNALNLQDDNYTATYSYDQIQTYSVIPASVKQSSATFIPKDIYASTNLLFDNSEPNYKKYNTNKSNNEEYSKDMTQSSSQIVYKKLKKSSYSQLQKSDGGIKLLKKQKQPIRLKQHDVQSQYKQKNLNPMLENTLTENIKTESLSKIIYKKSFRNKNHDYESQKLSLDQQTSNYAQIKNTTFYQNNKNTPQKIQKQTQYNLSQKNFLCLINKIQELQNIIVLYQQSILQLKNKIIKLQQKNKQQIMLQIFTDHLKQQLNQQKNKNAQIKQKLFLHQNYMKQHDQILFQSIDKIAKFYQKQITQVISLRKQNSFLKFLLQLQNLQNNQKILQKNNLKKLTNLTQNNFTQIQFNLSKSIQQLKKKNISKQIIKQPI